MTDARTIEIWPACPRCHETGDIQRGKHGTDWYAFCCKVGFNESGAKNTRTVERSGDPGRETLVELLAPAQMERMEIELGNTVFSQHISESQVPSLRFGKRDGHVLGEEQVTDQRALTVTNTLAPSTFAEAKAFAETLAKSDFVPQAFRGKPGDILAAVQMGAEVGLPPMAALQNIAVINGKPTIYGDAIPAVAQRHPDFESMDERFDDNTMTASCIVKRRGSPAQTRTFSQKDAENAGLWGKSGPWKQYPKRMLQMRARGFAMRDVFADAMKGLITREEAEDYPQVKIVNPEPESPVQAEPPPVAQDGSSSRQPPPAESAAQTPPTDKPAMPEDPEQGERGITLEQWMDVTQGLRDSQDNDDLKARYLKVVETHENTWTDAQFKTIKAYTTSLKKFHGGK